MTQSSTKLINTGYTTWQYSVISTLGVPPVSKSAGDRYLVINASGDWLSPTNYSNYIATWTGTAWSYIAPKTGMMVFNSATNAVNKYNGTIWIPAFTYVGTNPPALYTLGTMWFSTTDMLLYVYDNTNSRNKWLSVNRKIIDFDRSGSNAGGTALRIYGNVSGGNSGAMLYQNGVILSYTAQISAGSTAQGFTVTYYSDSTTQTTLAVSLNSSTYNFVSGLNLNIQKEKVATAAINAGGSNVTDPIVELEIAFRPSNV